MARWIRFFFAILVGIGLGLMYGWLINPVKYVDTTPDTLRIDYKTDYVLMASEAYQGDRDPVLAIQHLTQLGDKAPVDLVYQAILFAQQNNYTDQDIYRLQELLGVLQAFELVPESRSP